MPARHGVQPPDDFIPHAASLGIQFEDGDLDLLAEYLRLLLEANERFNLTSVVDPDEVWNRHILDSLTLLPYVASAIAELQPEHSLRIIDVGSGGGLPGIPLGIILRNAPVCITLLEATGKKARFLEHVIQQLKLKSINVLAERAESAGQDHGGAAHREMYDLVLARAVGRLAVLLELTIPFAKVGGYVLAMKGEKAAEEIAEAKAAMHLLHCRLAHSVPTHVGRGGGQLLVIEKSRKTPRAYPRKPGEPKRAPLGS